jgi:bacterioferritin
MMKKVTPEYIDLLNKAVTRELQVSVQYILQHTKMEKLLRKVIKENYLLDTTTYDEIGEFLKKISIEEMNHLADAMERIYILGGEAATKPDKITIGDTLKDFMELGVKAEEEALVLYDEIIQKAKEMGDRTTWQMFSQFYKAEEEHLITFQNYNEIVPEPDIPEPAVSEWRSIFEDTDYIALINEALASEMSAVVQYTTQHEKAEGLERLRKRKDPLEVATGKNKASVFSDLLKKVFMQEMEHIEMIAERLFEIDKEALPLIKPLPEIGETVEDFIKLDRDAEDYAIRLYRKIINQATEKGDIKTKRMFEEIIQQEEEHYWDFDDYA